MKYCYIPEGKIGRLELDITSHDVGLYTDNFTSCNIIFLIGNNRISMMHADKSISNQHLDNELNWIGINPEVYVLNRQEGAGNDGNKIKYKEHQLVSFLTKKELIPKMHVVSEEIEGLSISFRGGGEFIISTYNKENIPNLLHHNDEQKIICFHRFNLIFTTEITPGICLPPIIYDGNTWVTYPKNLFKLSDTAESVTEKFLKYPSSITIIANFNALLPCEKYLNLYTKGFKLTAIALQDKAVDYPINWLLVNNTFIIQEWLYLTLSTTFNPNSILTTNIQALLQVLPFELKQLSEYEGYIKEDHNNYIKTLTEIKNNEELSPTLLEELSQKINKSFKAIEETTKKEELKEYLYIIGFHVKVLVYGYNQILNNSHAQRAYVPSNFTQLHSTLTTTSLDTQPIPILHPNIDPIRVKAGLPSTADGTEQELHTEMVNRTRIETETNHQSNRGGGF